MGISKRLFTQHQIDTDLSGQLKKAQKEIQLLKTDYNNLVNKYNGLGAYWREAEYELDITIEQEETAEAKVEEQQEQISVIRDAMIEHRTIPTTRTVQRILDPYIKALGVVILAEPKNKITNL